MMVDLWLVGVSFMVLILVQALWALDLLIAEARRTFRVRRWFRLIRSGSVWLGLFNLVTGVLHTYFAVVAFREPFRQTQIALAVIVMLMAAFAALAWWFLPRPNKAEDAR